MLAAARVEERIPWLPLSSAKLALAQTASDEISDVGANSGGWIRTTDLRVMSPPL
jgi:hypothetical protein